MFRCLGDKISLTAQLSESYITPPHLPVVDYWLGLTASAAAVLSGVRLHFLLEAISRKVRLNSRVGP